MNLEEYNTVKKILFDEKEHYVYQILHYLDETLFDDEAYFKTIYNDLIRVAQQDETIKFYKFLEHNKEAKEEDQTIISDLEEVFNENIINELTKIQAKNRRY